VCILFFSLFVGLVSDLRHCLFVLCVCCYFFQHLLQASHGCLCDQRGRPLKDVIEDLPIVFVFEPLVPLLAGERVDCFSDRGSFLGVFFTAE